MDDLYKNRNFDYEPLKHGAVVAIRIYFADGERTPMADLKFAYDSEKYPHGVVETICWVAPQHRESFAAGINGYTLIYDERDKRLFDEW